MRVKIYSNEHDAWWKDNYFGYTNDESKAGVFEIEEVNKKYPYIDFDTTKEDYLVKFECLTYEELLKENQKLKKAIKFLAEQLGCPLEVVFKALKNGIWSVRYNTYQFSKINRLIYLSDFYYLVVEDSYYNLKDYKKTWFLKEDKSE